MRTFAIFRFTAIRLLLPIGLGWLFMAYLQSSLFPVDPALQEPGASPYGRISVILQLPGTASGIEEPIVTVGSPGNATFVFIRLLSQNRARVGIEFWGLASMESEAFSLPRSDAQINLTTSFPALCPGKSNAVWAGVSEGEKAHLLSHYVIAVDGVVRLSGEVHYSQPPFAPLFLGENPLGGSLVSDRFTGSVTNRRRVHP